MTTTFTKEIDAATKEIVEKFGTVIGYGQARNIAYAALISARAARAEEEIAEKKRECPWTSPNLPLGHQTVAGRLAELGALPDDAPARITAEDTISDGFWCKNYCNRMGLGVTQVDAPRKFRDMGITKINAYPVGVINKRIRQKHGIPC